MYIYMYYFSHPSLLTKEYVSMSTLPNPGIPLIGTEIWKMYKITSD